MQLNNSIPVNDWKIRKNLKLVLAVQLALWGVIGLDAIGLQVPIIRQLIGFIYLTFIPGILILRILKIHKLSPIKALLYTVGLSISFLMLVGLFMNIVYPFVGISNPLSALSLIATISIFILILCVIGYHRDKCFSGILINQKQPFHPPILLPVLVLLPALSIFGTWLMNNFDNNSFILLLILIISIVILLSTLSRKFLFEDYYPFAILMISISLLYMMSLISPYIIGWDIHHEYYFANLVYNASYWNYLIPDNVNGMLSIVILPTIYSHILNLQIDQIFKIIYPLLFSLVPLGLYELYSEETGKKIAFISVCFFMSFSVFFGEMTQLCRQQIAELFFVVMLLLIFDRKEDIDTLKRKILIIIFGMFIIVSHYAISYIFMFYLLSGFVLIFLLSNYTATKPNKNLTLGVITLYFVMSLSWYIYVSGSSSFNTIVGIGNNIFSSLYEFASLSTRDPTILKRIYLADLTSTERVKIGFEYITMFFIAIGVIKSSLSIIKNKKSDFNIDFFSMVLVSATIIAMCIGLPFFSVYLNMSRFYFQALFFLAPFFVFGGVVLFRLISKQLKRTIKTDTILFFISLILIAYFLFNTGFMYVATGESKETYTLPCLEKEGICPDLIYIYDEEVSSAKWLSTNINNESIAYADYNGKWMVLKSHAPKVNAYIFSNSTIWILRDTYIYFRQLNTKNKILERSSELERNYEYIDLQNTSFYKTFITHSNKIYDNGGSYLYNYD